MSKPPKPLTLSNPLTMRDACRLIEKYLPYIYDKIYIPFALFKEAEYDIDDVIEANVDSLFFSADYALDEDDELFDDLYEKYAVVIKKIFDPGNSLIFVLARMNKNNVKPSKSTFIKIIAEYDTISPVVISDLYLKLFKEGNKDPTDELNEIFSAVIEKGDAVMTEFTEKMQEMLTEFTMMPCGVDSGQLLISGISGHIWDYAKKLLELDYYGIHDIFLNIVGLYIPIDYVINYASGTENDNRQLIIV